jgi:hypothetical protein
VSDAIGCDVDMVVVRVMTVRYGADGDMLDVLSGGLFVKLFVVDADLGVVVWENDSIWRHGGRMMRGGVRARRGKGEASCCLLTEIT